MAAGPTTLDPHGHAHNMTSIVLAHFYDQLVTFDADMQVGPRLAERWENPSETLWRFHLRQDVVFHDGRPLEAEDVVASLRRAMRPDSPRAYTLHPVLTVRAASRFVVEIETRAPLLALTNRLAFVSIVPRDAPEVIVTPVGTGPYRFVAGPSGDRITGRRFEGFWNDPPAFATASFITIPDDDRRAEAITSGEADIVYQYPSARWQWGLAQPSMQMRSSGGLHSVLAVFSLAEGSPFADLRLRRAAALAVDRTALVEQGLGGLGTALDQVVPPAVRGYADDLSPLVPDPPGSARLLDEAGFGGGIEAPLYTARTYEAIVRALVAQWRDVGIRLEPQILAQGDFYARLTSGPLPVAVFGWTAETGDASATLGPLFHTPTDGLGGFNKSSYSNPRVDSLIERADRATRPRHRLARFAEVMGILREDVPAIPLVTIADLYAVRAGLDWQPPVHRYLRLEDVRPAGP